MTIASLITSASAPHLHGSRPSGRMRILIDSLPVVGTGGHLLLLADDVECTDAVFAGDHYDDHPG